MKKTLIILTIIGTLTSLTSLYSQSVFITNFGNSSAIYNETFSSWDLVSQGSNYATLSGSDVSNVCFFNLITPVDIGSLLTLVINASITPTNGNPLEVYLYPDDTGDNFITYFLPHCPFGTSPSEYILSNYTINGTVDTSNIIIVGFNNTPIGSATITLYGLRAIPEPSFLSLFAIVGLTAFFWLRKKVFSRTEQI
ncbi:MAG: hypothetical protein N2035_10105 [Chthoniobacterales bacterium]|nr:hypothetical protein [Chthoniobacterales bacterium]